MTKQIELPLISICIPTYNGAKHILRCLQSIDEQNYSNIEIIISDDNSSDDTLEICEAFAKNTSIPLNIVSHPPKNIADNWNHCIALAKGEYVKLVFQDDSLAYNCIEKMAAKMQESNADFVYCNRSFLVDGNLKNNARTQQWIKRYGDLHRYWKLAPEDFEHGKLFLNKASHLFSYPLNKIGEPSVTLIRKSLFDTAGLFDTQLQQLTDVELYYRMFALGKIAYVNEALIQIGIHVNQATQNNIKQNKADEDMLLYETLKAKIGSLLHSSTKLFPLKYRIKNSARILKKKIIR